MVVAAELGPEAVAAGFGEEGVEGDVGAGVVVGAWGEELFGVAVEVGGGVFGDEDAVAHGADVGAEVGEGAAVGIGEVEEEGGVEAGVEGAGLGDEFDVDGVVADGGWDLVPGGGVLRRLPAGWWG